MKPLALLLAIAVLIGISCKEKADFSEPVWFPFQAHEQVANSEIEASDLLDAPAGKHGYLQSIDDRLIFEDGTETKFWGVNICSRLPYSEQEVVNDWVDYLERYGVNAVRFHKFSSHGLKAEKSTEIRDDKYERMDYFHSRLKEKGIYYTWSHIYGHKPRKEDSVRLLNYGEVTSTSFPWAHLNGSTASIVNFAEDLQDLSIELTTNMLRHKNPHTGMTYAQDPALVCIEMQNEDNIFWGAMENTLEQTPAYRKLLCQKFSNWLKEKYGTQRNLEAAWGKDILSSNETIQNENVYPQPNHHVFSKEYKEAQVQGRSIQQHFLDKAQFLYETQRAYYDRFEDSIRATGYKGTLVASCWQAGSGITHYYNLLADYETGMVDRHNYFGGGTGHRLTEGDVRNEAMVNQPGSGLLSIGMQMVKDRPFAFSEWMSLMPNEWTAEAAPIIAAYGMGLQGWDASFSFASNDYKISNTVQANSHGVYNVESPLHITLYPALSRMVLRGDVAEAPVISERIVAQADLHSGELRFDEEVRQDHDRKYITGDFPSYLLAYGKIPVAFGSQSVESNYPSLPEYVAGDAITSMTGDLSWQYNDKGYFMIDTKGTQGVVGFSGGRDIELKDFSLNVATPFSVVLISSLDPELPLSDAKEVLITTIARAKNSGMKYNEDKTKLIEVGEPPVLMEPVQATIKIKANDEFRLTVLDHVGVKRDVSILIDQKSIVLDGSKHKAIYYLLERI